MSQTSSDWDQLSKNSITAIKFNVVDRLYILAKITECFSSEFKLPKVLFWNCGYKYFQEVTVSSENQSVNLEPTEYVVEENPIDACYKVDEVSVFIFEGLGRIDKALNFQLRNFYFKYKTPNVNNKRILIIDEDINIPLELYSLIPRIEFGIPNIPEINGFLSDHFDISNKPELSQACFGLPRGEIEILIEKRGNCPDLIEQVTQYKTGKLAGRGLRIVPPPDIDGVGGLDLLEQDLQKIKKLFTPEAATRGLRPPKGCCLWGLPGTGKSLVSKMMSAKLNATLISCDWNELLESDLARSLAKLQYVLDVVDNIGNCILFFDEFEKAFAGWNTGSNGGVLAKMAGKLLTWMQDHESPSIMLATINHLDMLPPELIRRFGYIWFFPAEMHEGAMWDVFKLHIEKHFPGFHEFFTDTQWRKIFLTYKGCSPAEIAGAVTRTNDDIFFREAHKDLTPDKLVVDLLNERKNFKPAITNRSTSNALSKILMEADFARPVRGKDTSKFAVVPKGLFETDDDKEMITVDEYVELVHKIRNSEDSELNQDFSYAF